jgi:AraC-like DNA-binding protein
MRALRLEVLAYLPPPLLSHLRIVLAGSTGSKLCVAEEWNGFVTALNRATADVVIADPCAYGRCRGAQLAALLATRPTLPVVIYTPVSPASFQAIAELARNSPRHAAPQVVLHRYDDEPARFLGLLERQAASSLSVAILELVGPALTALPPALSRAVERLIRQPTEFHSVADLANSAQVTVRTAYRHLGLAGFASPRVLVVGARLLHAYAYARDPRQSLDVIANKVGYSAPRMVTKHMREAVGRTPRAVRRQMRPAEFVNTLAQWMYPACSTSSIAAADVHPDGESTASESSRVALGPLADLPPVAADSAKARPLSREWEAVRTPP